MKKKKQSNVAKGIYYKRKTKKYLEGLGFTVEYSERTIPISRYRFIRKDIFGADLIAMDGKEIWFVNSVFGMGNIAAHRKGFAQYPFPPHVKRIVVQWPVKRVRIPKIHNCSS